MLLETLARLKIHDAQCMKSAKEACKCNGGRRGEDGEALAIAKPCLDRCFGFGESCGGEGGRIAWEKITCFDAWRRSCDSLLGSPLCAAACKKSRAAAVEWSGVERARQRIFEGKATATLIFTRQLHLSLVLLDISLTAATILLVAMWVWETDMLSYLKVSHCWCIELSRHTRCVNRRARAHTFICARGGFFS